MGPSYAFRLDFSGLPDPSTELLKVGHKDADYGWSYANHFIFRAYCQNLTIRQTGDWDNGRMIDPGRPNSDVTLIIGDIYYFLPAEPGEIYVIEDG